MSMRRDGSAQPAVPTTRAGTPATVTLFGTDLMTTEPEAMRAQCPTSILPRIFGARADQHAVADFRMAVAVFLAGTAERHTMQHRHIVIDHRGLADHDARGVVDENATTEFSQFG